MFLKAALLAAAFTLSTLASGQQTLRNKLNTLVNDTLLNTSQLALCVYDLTADSLLYEYQARQRMRPASTQKIITAVAAINVLGSHYCLNTSISYTGTISNSTLWGNLYVTGGFDPTFNSGDLDTFIEAIKHAGIDSIAGCLCADRSLKDTLQWGYGWCWDDDMPHLSPMLYEATDSLIPQLEARLRTAGIKFTTTSDAPRPNDATTLTTHSTPLNEILQKMMKESDNLCAEALFYHLAAHSATPYASRNEATHYIDSITTLLGFNPTPFTPADGSGVSLYNYTSARLETAYLKYAFTHKDVFELLYASLPVSGRDGTLKHRMREPDVRGKVHAKTGTVTGVSSLAGYVTTSSGHMLAFCIINQGITRAAHGRQFQDKVCRILCNY